MPKRAALFGTTRTNVRMLYMCAYSSKPIYKINVLQHS